MARVADAVIEVRKKEALELVHRMSEERGGEARVSHRYLSAVLGTSKEQAARVLRNLEADGLVTRRPRFGGDGGQLENGYSVTPRGARLLEAGARRPGRALR